MGNQNSNDAADGYDDKRPSKQRTSNSAGRGVRSPLRLTSSLGVFEQV